jgi:hypothetical protein
MKKPTPSELREFARSIGFHDFDAMAFIHYYDSIGWMVGKHKMKVWRAAVWTWKRKQQQRRPAAMMPYRQREAKINKLNLRKQQLIREGAPYWKIHEIDMQLSDL